MGWFVWAPMIVGLIVFVWGLWQMIADGRRILYGVALIGGFGLALFCGLVVAAEHGHLIPLGAFLVLCALVPLFSYPVLTVFLLANGVTMLRKERLSLGNALSLLAGLGMVGLVAMIFVNWPESWGATTRTVVTSLMFLVLTLAGYVATCFAAFWATSLLSGRLTALRRPDAIIVLGAGLLDGDRVPPLLAGRLAKAREVQQRFAPPPVLIPSGGQGADESVPEGVAMGRFLVAAGTPSDLVLPETASRTTRENLQLSRHLLPAPDAPVIVVTSNYHALRAGMLTRSLGLNARVVGAPTAGYYYPSALIREFVAVMVEHRRWHLAVTGVVVVGYVLLLALALTLA